jgi:transcriptional regulator with XRE-family HTH domain
MARAKDRTHTARDVFAANMKSLRAGKGLSQERLAGLARLHPNYIGSVERRERNISIDNIEKIAAALAVPIASLFAKPTGRGE